MYYAYVLESLRDGTYYYGSSDNPQARVAYTRARMPWKLVYQERFITRQQAMRRERFFKSGKGREFIKGLLK